MTFTVSFAKFVKLKAGSAENVTGLSTSAAIFEDAQRMGENKAKAFLNIDLDSKWSSLSGSAKNVITQYVYSVGAIEVISYDSSKYASPREAELRIDILDQNIKALEDDMKETKFKDKFGLQ